MNEQITNNLYLFWKTIGESTNRLIVTDYYTAVSMQDSDWPNRIFDLKNNNDTIERILKFNQEEKTSRIVTIGKSNVLETNSNFKFLFEQKNMALDLKIISKNISKNTNIKQIQTKEDSINFAKIASKAFGYQVHHNVIYQIINDSEKICPFIYQEDSEYLGCGIVFFDSNNNAGLHMIGTIPKGRGKGIGKSMTERLLYEAKEAGMDLCVLHASMMGEPIYRKLGFEPYGKIKTYKI